MDIYIYIYIYIFNANCNPCTRNKQIQATLRRANQGRSADLGVHTGVNKHVNPQASRHEQKIMGFLWILERMYLHGVFVPYMCIYTHIYISQEEEEICIWWYVVIRTTNHLGQYWNSYATDKLKRLSIQDNASAMKELAIKMNSFPTSVLHKCAAPLSPCGRSVGVHQWVHKAFQCRGIAMILLRPWLSCTGDTYIRVQCDRKERHELGFQCTITHVIYFRYMLLCNAHLHHISGFAYGNIYIYIYIYIYTSASLHGSDTLRWGSWPLPALTGGQTLGPQDTARGHRQEAQRLVECGQP